MAKPNFEVNCGFCEKVFSVKRKSYLDLIRRNNTHIFFCSKECRTSHQKTGKVINCVTCGREIYKTLKELEEGSRFCSRSCAASVTNLERVAEGITTKGKNKTLFCAKCGAEYIGSIHTPISTGLCSSCHPKVFSLNCVGCGITIQGSCGKKYCDICRTGAVSSKIQIRINNGLLFSKAIKCSYPFHGSLIRCDSKLEYVCLKYFQSKYDILSMERASIILQYTLDGKTRNYYPDFEIILKDGTKYLVECKGVVGKKLDVKWNSYNRKSTEKKKVLEKWCKENGYIPFWFDQQRHNKIYQNTKIDM